jgi:hypothetical protein
MLNILGVARTITIGLQTLHTTFGGFGLLSVATEQLICRINMLLQHYHTSTNLSRKLEASLRYLQLQLGTPHHIGLQQMGTPSTTFLGQDVVEVATPLQHPSAHGMCNNSKSQGKRPGSNGTDIWEGPQQKDDKKFE